MTHWRRTWFAALLFLELVLCKLGTGASTSSSTDGVGGSGGSGGKAGSRCLIVTIDNRDLQPGYHDQHYLSMTAVINHAYATHHNYDFYYLQNDVSNLVSEALKKYPRATQDPMMLDGQHVAKDVASGFHVGLQQFRAASWAKLPALWYITKKLGHKYDYVWYIDSDAAVSPFAFNRSIDDAVRDWQRREETHHDMVLLGNRDVTRSKLLFFSNFPWRDDLPCAGSFLFRPRLHAEALFREWWDYDLPSKNFKHFHEQDALWHMIEHEQGRGASADAAFRERWQRHFATATATAAAPAAAPGGRRLDEPVANVNRLNRYKYATLQARHNRSALHGDHGDGRQLGAAGGGAPHRPHRFRINNDTFSVVREQQFPSAWTRYESLWLTHIASYNFAARMPILYQLLQRLGLAHEAAYRAAVEHLTHRHRLLLRPLEVAEAMEAASQREHQRATAAAAAAAASDAAAASHGHLRPRVTLWPPHDDATQGAWYDAHVSSRSVPPLPLATLYEGRLVRKKNEFWVVSGGVKRGFASFAAFLQCHFFVDDVAHSLYAPQLAQIPDDPAQPTLPADTCRGVRPWLDEALRAVVARQPPAAQKALLVGPAQTIAPAALPSLLREVDWRSFDTDVRIDALCREITRHYRPVALPPPPSTTTTTTAAAGGDCGGDEELQRLVAAPGTRTRLFIIAHSDESRALAEAFVACHAAAAWAEVVTLPPSVFFESLLYNASFLPARLAAHGTGGGGGGSGGGATAAASLFSPYLPTDANASSAATTAAAGDVDFVVTATYKTVARALHYNGFSQSTELIYGHLKLARHFDFDVVPFLRAGSDFVTFVRYWHGAPFLAAWDALLRALQYSEAQIRAFDRTRLCFYRNVFVAKTAAFRRLAGLMQRAMHVAQTDATVRQLLAVDARYKEGQPEVAQRVFGTPHYQLHPFVFERLPAFFAFTERLRVCIGDGSPCKYNS
eukprot:gene8331-6011_t